MTTAISSPWFAQQFFSASGRPLAGGQLYFYAAGTNFPKAVYADPDFQTPLPNPLSLDSAGRPQHYLLGAGYYRIELKDANDNLVAPPMDYVAGATTTGGGGGAVDSVFGRTGSVEAQAGDYTASMVGAEPDLGDPASDGFLASSLADGTRSWVSPSSLGLEPSLGTPNDNGSILVSTTTGDRSWLAPGDLNTGFTGAKVTGLQGKPLPAFGTTALLRYDGTDWTWDSTTYQPNASNLDALSAAQGNGYFRRVGGVWTMDPGTYVQNITLQNDVTGSGTSTILTTVVGIRGVSVPALSSGKLTYTTGANTFSWMPTVSSAGVTGSIPNFNRSTDAIIVNAFEVNIYTNSAFLGEPVKLHVPQSVITNIPRDGNTKFIAVNYNGGFPFSYLESVKANINSSDIVAIASLWNSDGNIHLTDFGLSGDGLNNKLQFQHLDTQPYQKSLEGGLVLSNDLARHVGVTQATVYYGGVRQVVPEYGSTNTNHKLTMVYHSAGTWLYSTVNTGGQYNNTQYDNGTNLVTMAAGKCAMRWMYRSIGDDTQVFYVLGSAEYNNTPSGIAQAEAEAKPDISLIPQILRDHCLLVGKILVVKGANTGTAYQISSDSGSSSSGSPIVDHALLGNLNSTSYYHLTQAQYIDLTDGGDTTLHYHAADRNRANHSGTQTASTISDFTTTVNNLIANANISGGTW